MRCYPVFYYKKATPDFGPHDFRMCTSRTTSIVVRKTAKFKYFAEQPFGKYKIHTLRHHLYIPIDKTNTLPLTNTKHYCGNTLFPLSVL